MSQKRQMPLAWARGVGAAEGHPARREGRGGTTGRALAPAEAGAATSQSVIGRSSRATSRSRAPAISRRSTISEGVWTYRQGMETAPVGTPSRLSWMAPASVPPRVSTSIW